MSIQSELDLAFQEVAAQMKSRIPVRIMVVTGLEPRGDSDFVIWVGGTTQPAEMIDGDLWYRESSTPIEDPPVISTTALNSMTEDVAFSQTLSATNSPTSWSIQSGAIPGLSIDNSGVLSGTPTTSGSYSMVVRATNSYGFDEHTYSGTISTTGGASYSIFGVNSPGTATINNDGGGSLFIGNRFYTTESAGIDAIGIRIWEPPTADSTFLNLDITARAFIQDWVGTFLNSPLATTPLQEKTYTAARLADTWTEILFDAPIHLNPVGSGAGSLDMLTLAIGYSGGQAYISLDRNGDAVESIGEPGTYLSENADIGRGVNSIGTSPVATYYGIDLIFEVS